MDVAPLEFSTGLEDLANESDNDEEDDDDEDRPRGRQSQKPSQQSSGGPSSTLSEKLLESKLNKAKILLSRSMYVKYVKRVYFVHILVVFQQRRRRPPQAEIPRRSWQGF